MDFAAPVRFVVYKQFCNANKNFQGANGHEAEISMLRVVLKDMVLLAHLR